MEKYIELLVKRLKWELFAAAVIVLLTGALGELNVIPNGVFSPFSEEEFVLDAVAIMSAMLGIPAALRLFTLQTTRGLRRMNNDEALNHYHIWSIARMCILCVVGVFCLVSYYLTMSVSCAFCALIVLCAMVYCWPTETKVRAYMEKVDK